MRHGCLAIALAVTLLTPFARSQDRQPAPWVTGLSRPENLEVYLVTVGPGSEIVSYFGHTALIVEDVARAESRIYDYGQFSFGRDTLPRYLMGQLTFALGEGPAQPSIDRYRALDRSVRLQTLGLTPDEKLALATFLATNALPDNREYTYHHYFDNCTTRVRDAIDAVIGGQIQAQSAGPARMTLRDHTRRFTRAHILVELLLMYWMNDEIDQPITEWDEMFLPAELEQRLREFWYVNSMGVQAPLVQSSRTLVEGLPEPPSSVPVPLWPMTTLPGVLLGSVPVLLAVARRRALYSEAARVLLGLHCMVVGAVIGLPALVLFLLAAFTEHTVTYWNENLLLANPLTTAILPMGALLTFRKKSAPIRTLGRLAAVLSGCGILLIALKILPSFDQANMELVTLILPVNLGLLVACRLWPSGTEPRFR